MLQDSAILLKLNIYYIYLAGIENSHTHIGLSK